MNGKNAGFSLISVIIAIGLMGLLAVGINHILNSGFRGNAKLRIDQERLYIANQIIERIDCRQTFSTITPSACIASSSAVTLRQEDGTPIYPGNRIGKSWIMRVNCNVQAGIEGLTVKLAKVVPDTMPRVFWKDPLGGGLLNFNHRKADLFDAGTRPCGSMFTGALTPGDQTCPVGEVLRGIRANGEIICSAYTTTKYSPPCTAGGSTMTVNHTMCSISRISAWTFGYHDADDMNCSVNRTGPRSWEIYARCHDIDRNNITACTATCFD